MLAGILHSESLLRRKMVRFGINNKYRKVTEEAPIGEWLFKDTFEERLQNAKALERSAHH